MARGETLLAVSKSLESFCINMSTRSECASSYILIKNREHVIAVCYRPPNADASFVNGLHDPVNNVKT